MTSCSFPYMATKLFQTGLYSSCEQIHFQGKLIWKVSLWARQNFTALLKKEQTLSHR